MKKHNNTILGNRIKCPTVVDWYPSDTKERFESLPKEHQDYWHEQPPITYNLNTYGFRSDEFPEKEYKQDKRYYLQQHEIEAQVVGFKRKAKLQKRPIEEVIREYFERRKTRKDLINLFVERLMGHYKAFN